MKNNTLNLLEKLAQYKINPEEAKLSEFELRKAKKTREKLIKKIQEFTK